MMQILRGCWDASSYRRASKLPHSNIAVASSRGCFELLSMGAEIQALPRKPVERALGLRPSCEVAWGSSSYDSKGVFPSHDERMQQVSCCASGINWTQSDFTPHASSKKGKSLVLRLALSTPPPSSTHKCASRATGASLADRCGLCSRNTSCGFSSNQAFCNHSS